MHLPRSLAATTTLALATIVSIAAFSLLDPALGPADSATAPTGAGQHDHAQPGPTELSGSADDQHDHHHDAATNAGDPAHGDADPAASNADGHEGHGNDDGHDGHTPNPTDQELPPLKGTTESTLARLRAMDPERLASLHDH